ncbi:hypothetical protein M758_7G135500 [Ceratodon purpureus]|nr:hypothetical protein M758_7G135500 [Ceratodon purpureus]
METRDRKMKSQLQTQWWQPDDAADNGPETSRRRDVLNVNDDRLTDSMREDDPILEPKHKIFLSHSGAQKDFVEYLCGELERRHHFPFFDRRASSLPKGERFPELILKAAQQCKMAVVVISEDYFASKWPMIELNAFVQARSRSNTRLKILPLFYKLSVLEFGNEERRAQWFKKWEGWAQADVRININEWKEALKVLASFNGIEYNPILGGTQTYLKSIVTSICEEIHPDIKWYDSHVQGSTHLCQEIQDKIQQVQRNEVCVVGFYGMGGIGKTTICKALCNVFCQEFEGKVTHVEFGSQSPKELLCGVIQDLTNTSPELLQRLILDKCKHIFHKTMREQKIFLALDNVWDDFKSIEEAKMYLQAHFHDKSIVMVTSRSLKTLTYLGIDESNCFPMPELGHKDAKKLLLYHAASGKQFSSHQDKQDIEECIAFCYFSKDKKGGRHYLPLALKALGVQLGCVGNEPSMWVKTLPKVKDFNYLEEENNPVFSILRSSFDRLQAVDQNVFMDVVLFTPRLSPAVGLIHWLSLVYSQDLQEIQSRLRRLKERGLLEAVNMTSQTIRVHDLYREFAELEAEGKLNAKKFKKRMWVNYKDTFPAELEMTPSHTCWQNLTRLSIVAKSRSSWQDSRSLEGIEWRNCSNVVVLELKKLDRLRGDLNLAALKCLKSLGLIDIYELDTLDGLQDLNNLNYISWVNYNKDNPSKVVHTRMGQLPSSLKVLQLFVEVWLGPDVISRCTDLRELDLARCEADNLDFSNCLSLQSIWLCSLPLRALWGLSATTVTLSNLHVSLCLDLVEIPDLAHLVGLQLLELTWNVKFKKLPDLEKLTSLQVLSIDRMEIGGLGCLRRLRELEFTYLPPSVLKLPNLSGFEKLQDVDFSHTEN